MASKIFVNLPVEDLDKSLHFYTSMGFTINPKFSDDTAACIVISNEIFVMLLTKPKFEQFTTKAVADAKDTTEVINALSIESRDLVDQLAEKALQSGGAEAKPATDHGFMYIKSISDPDGHIWELAWMDESAFA